MFVIIGCLVVVGSVAGGFIIEGGHILVLMQVVEFIIIGGAAIGALLISTPAKLLKKIVQRVLGLLTNWGKVQIGADLQGLPRVVSTRKPESSIKAC